MRRSAIRLSMLTICATALAAVPFFTTGSADARTRHAHMKKHARHWHDVHRPWIVGEPRPYVAPYAPSSGWVCPGIGRSFECKIWPPPIADDPDRRPSKY
jgi:hypothetical protein